MALIDEYKQAIQDVLDGRAKEAPRPSELPWTEDKAATMWAAAAAELIAEANAPAPSSGALVIEYSSSGTTTSKYQDLKDALESSTPVFVKILWSNGTSKLLPVRVQSSYQGSLSYNFQGITSVLFSNSTLSISTIYVSANTNLNATLPSFTTKTYSMSADVS